MGARLRVFLTCDQDKTLLNKYCSEMNPIELEWQHLKNDELVGKMFDNELELAYAVIDGVQVRGERGNYST
ncbi:hypothetical protein [Nostoc sp.]|uniref:hypothetical protein n=1 Tax=Nostoc sp. TaxID=1180 RepID=UPI002FF9AA37